MISKARMCTATSCTHLLNELGKVRRMFYKAIDSYNQLSEKKANTSSFLKIYVLLPAGNHFLLFLRLYKYEVKPAERRMEHGA